MPMLTSQRKRQRNLVIVFIAVLTVTLGVLYFGVLSKEEPEVFESDTSIFRGTREVRLNLELLKEEQLRGFVPYDKLRTVIETGRKNPFVPYSINTATSTKL